MGALPVTLADDLGADLHDSIQRRGLMVTAVDAKGNVLRWEDPAVIDIRIASIGAGYFYRLPALVRPLLKARGVLLEADELATLLDDLKTEIIARGRRHAMAGSFDE